MVRVVDGDTIIVDIASRRERVRLIGIDTPESVKPRTPPECFSLQASQDTKALLPKGSQVRLERDVEARDIYGRLLAYVYRVSDGAFVNLVLARQGDAGLLTYRPNTAHLAELSAAVAQARASGEGLWSRCGAVHEPAAPGRQP